MFNQLFDSKNFRKIFDIENRKGLYIEKKFFPDLYGLSKELKINKQEMKKVKACRNLDIQAKNEKLSELKDQQKLLKQRKEDALTKKIEEIVKKNEKDNWRILLEKSVILKDKQTYKISSTPESYFLMKQLQYNVYNTYKVKTANRQHIIAQLKNIIKEDLSKAVIVTDIESFYENIDTERLLQKINEDNLLSSISKIIITNLLKQYMKISGTPRGIPRGIGISSFLAEIYMKDFDSKIRQNEQIFYYARYVDDMVIITTEQMAAKIKELIKENLQDIDLTLNKNKTKICTTKSFDFLGYKFSMTNKILTLSEKRMTKYRNKISSAFEAYQKKYKTNRNKASKLLVNRIKYLTGNTKLKNNKSSILTGSYFSNILLESDRDLRKLDFYLTQQIKNISNNKLADKLSKYSFMEGFNLKKFYNFSLQELTEITKIWKEV